MAIVRRTYQPPRDSVRFRAWTGRCRVAADDIMKNA